MAMTIEEKRDEIKRYCNHLRGDCLAKDNPDGVECPLFATTEDCYEDISAELVDRNYELLFGKAPTTDTSNDIINHPSHYCREGGMESIEEMVLVFGKEAVKNFCLCNVWKYRYRSSSKNGEEDLKKSDWYMRKYRELSNE